MIIKDSENREGISKINEKKMATLRVNKNQNEDGFLASTREHYRDFHLVKWLSRPSGASAVWRTKPSASTAAATHDANCQRMWLGSGCSASESVSVRSSRHLSPCPPDWSSTTKPSAIDSIDFFEDPFFHVRMPHLSDHADYVKIDIKLEKNGP